jgi:hypothetical protein
MSNTVYVGIDCGLDGALAFLAPSHFDGVAFSDTPTLDTGKGSRRTYDIPAMAKILRDWMSAPGVLIVALEQQQSMPKQGVASTFSTGFGYGVWQGLLVALGIPYELVHPKAWKKAMMPDAPKEKEASVLVASRLYPGVADKLKTERGRALHGRADALLLAEYMRRRHAGGS